MQRTSCLAAAVLLSGCVSHWSASSAPLAASLRQELAQPAPLESSQAPLAAARDCHFLFIGGFLNETIPGYFADNVAVVREELGAPASTLFPPSAGTLDVDAALIRDEVNRLSEAEHRPVVLVGHSKGAAAAVLAVLRYPELVETGRVDRVVAIQGAFGGSPVADGLVTSVPVPLLHAHFQGLSALSRAKAHAAFGAGLARPRTLPLDAWLKAHVFFVRSFEASSDVAPELLLTHGYLSRFGSGRSDGLMLAEDMKLDGLGTDLGVLKGDHAAFTVSGALSNSSPAERRAFTRALLRQVFAAPVVPAG